MNTWSVTEAKARLSEVIRRCQKERQTITRRGIPVAEMMSVEEYLRLGGRLPAAGAAQQAESERKIPR